MIRAPSFVYDCKTSQEVKIQPRQFIQQFLNSIELNEFNNSSYDCRQLSIRMPRNSMQKDSKNWKLSTWIVTEKLNDVFFCMSEIEVMLSILISLYKIISGFVIYLQTWFIPYQLENCQFQLHLTLFGRCQMWLHCPPQGRCTYLTIPNGPCRCPSVCRPLARQTARAGQEDSRMPTPTTSTVCLADVNEKTKQKKKKHRRDLHKRTTNI